MDRFTEPARLLAPTQPRWRELLQNWALDGLSSGTAQEAMRQNGAAGLSRQRVIPMATGPFVLGLPFWCPEEPDWRSPWGKGRALGLER